MEKTVIQENIQNHCKDSEHLWHLSYSVFLCLCPHLKWKLCSLGALLWEMKSVLKAYNM